MNCSRRLDEINLEFLGERILFGSHIKFAKEKDLPFWLF